MCNVHIYCQPSEIYSVLQSVLYTANHQRFALFSKVLTDNHQRFAQNYTKCSLPTIRDLHCIPKCSLPTIRDLHCTTNCTLPSANHQCCCERGRIRTGTAASTYSIHVALTTELSHHPATCCTWYTVS